MTDSKDPGEQPGLLIARISCVPVARGALEATMFVHKVYSSRVSKGGLPSRKVPERWRRGVHVTPGKAGAKDICALVCKS